MNKLLIILFLFISTSLFSQRERDIFYNSWDTTWTLQYHHMLSIRENIETLKNEKIKLEKEVVILEAAGGMKDLIIKKLQVRDSLSVIELNHYATMDSILREKLDRFNTITNNYNALLISTQEQLNAEAKKARREKLWKGIYKYGYPVAIGIVGFIILRS